MDDNKKHSNGKPDASLETLEDIKDFTKPRNRPFTIVALGGSAGSLHADMMNEAVLVLDASLHIISVNQSFLRLFHVGEEQVAGRYLYDLGTGQWQIAPLRKLLEEVLPNKTDFTDYIIEHDFPEVGHKKLGFRGSRFVQPQTRKEMILLVIEEVQNR